MNAKDLLPEVFEKIASAPTKQLRIKYYRALNSSLRMDSEHIVPKLISPNDLSDYTGIPLDVLVDNGICITRKDGWVFVSRLGFDLSYTSFRKKYTHKAYMRAFNREGTMLDGKTFVFTYSEMLHMTGYRIEIEVPEDYFLD